MSKVYCVFKGAYSDRELLAIFSTKEKALTYIAIREELEKDQYSSTDSEPIEYELDRESVAEPMALVVNLSSGTIDTDAYCFVDDPDDLHERHLWDDVWLVRLNREQGPEGLRKAAFDRAYMLKSLAEGI